MTFTDLVAGDAVFVDANTFIYHFTPDPILGPACTALLLRIENQELAGYTSLHLLAELAHKMMTIEANRILGWPFGHGQSAASSSIGGPAPDACEVVHRRPLPQPRPGLEPTHVRPCRGDGNQPTERTVDQ
jgi:hypothetical protein